VLERCPHVALGGLGRQQEDAAGAGDALAVLQQDRIDQAEAPALTNDLGLDGARRHLGGLEQVDGVASRVQVMTTDLGQPQLERAGEGAADGNAVHLVVLPHAAGDLRGDELIVLEGEHGQGHELSLSGASGNQSAWVTQD
jgi:hypothetical protein